MRKLLNTLYITTPEAYLSKDGLNVIVSVDKEEKFRIPIMNVESIVTFGYMGASPGLMSFNGRSRRPPKNEVNAMLSFVYTLIANDVSAALESVGLDPYVGFMHTLRPGRTSLALDMMEELRAYLGDRLVLSMINRKQVTKKDFIRQGDESFVMTDDCRKELLTTWQKRKKETIEHPYLKEKIPIGLLPYAQSMLLARFLREDLDDYPVFLMR